MMIMIMMVNDDEVQDPWLSLFWEVGAVAIHFERCSLLVF